MKVWNVNTGTQRELFDLGTYGTREAAMERANKEMRNGDWKKTYDTEDQIMFFNGTFELTVESIYVI